ncbi:MAG: endolytic transglycosylase MltG [Okeania sp. SIO2G4]|uniref:endolytic transglycosylase MltG n=1 Tax=unclassified Okeania TaxID=2634635 RepID=UPI0013B8D734|nr:MULTISPECIES: endolytic transglycosylase MltG [unclassified Okeania]NEP04824.1 endolytic transglycosylase MltG [Okeania sp. SIO4D6]NEP42175.1 endolytic transglycosylase MltG [Okeania sp. SIO2H7]NEP73510.1 endolytic transglycosylase MltG [Okeania sp. SIO2G5]NEP95975.1 endolytic transglycosylase MltG [Okeania sp. SIO2F5]NEQ92933.1 endolytic transglycosylase MltG [Okeania sp. SIO2G4]
MRNSIKLISNRALFYLAILPVSCGIFAWQGWAWWSWVSGPLVTNTSSTQSPEENAVTITIPVGTYGQQIGEDLEAAGIIRSATAWNFWVKWLGIQNPDLEFKAGTYKLSPTEPLSAIADKILEGDVVKLSYTIREGWSIQQMAEYLEAQGFFPAADFIAATRNIPYDKFPWLPSNIPHLEGYLFPDTYKIEAQKNTPEAIINQMLGQFEKIALPVYQKNLNNAENLNLHEWVTLASIVEKESVVSEERGVISGVFNNRLKKGMRLAADPTVEYGLGIRQTKEKPLTYSQVETPSPYNTYLNIGLPPTAIASPGLASLEATLNPDDTEYLYFMARYDGTHIFSRTAAEHEAAIAEVERMLSSQ